MKRLLLTLFALLICAPIYAQTAGYSVYTPFGAATSATSAGGTTQTTGSTFVVTLARKWGVVMSDSPAISDSKSNTYTHAQTLAYSYANAQFDIWYCINCTGGSSHTVTGTWSTTSTNGALVFFEIKSMGAATFHSAPAGTYANGSGVTTLAAPSITTAVANEIVVNTYISSGSNVETITDSGAPWTIVTDYSGYSGANGAMSWAIISSGGSAVADTFSWTNTVFPGALAISFKPAGSGGTCTKSGFTSAGASATPNGTTGSYVGNAGAFVTPDCSTVNYWQPSGGAFGVN